MEPRFNEPLFNAVLEMPEVFFSLGLTELSGKAAKASREAAGKKTLADKQYSL